MAEPAAPPEAPGAVQCRLQYLEDADPFCCAAFPEPRRPPGLPVAEALPLAAQLPAFLRLLGAPLRLEDCALQVLPSGHYLDLELSLLEQKDELEVFYEDISKGRRPILLLRTQLSVRVHAIIEKLYRSKGPELRRSLFSLKQLFQDDKDLVPEFVNSEGLTCLVSVGAEADQNYQNYILRALSQIMLFVDGMMGVIQHPETVRWLYTLTGSPYRLVVKTALKLLLVFVEFTESNAQLLIQAVVTVEQGRGGVPWSRLVAILEQKSGADTELQVFAMTLINKTLAALPDQDSFYDVTDCLEQQGMEQLIQAHLASKGTDPDLRQQLALYENALKEEDEPEEPLPGTRAKERRRGDEGRQGARRSFLAAEAQEENKGVPAAADTFPNPQETLDLEGGSCEQLPSPSASCIQLSVPLAPVEGPQLAGLGERSVFKLHETASAWREEAPPVCGDKPILRHFDAFRGETEMGIKTMEGACWAGLTEEQVGFGHGCPAKGQARFVVPGGQSEVTKTDEGRVGEEKGCTWEGDPAKLPRKGKRMGLLLLSIFPLVLRHPVRGRCEAGAGLCITRKRKAFEEDPLFRGPLLTSGWNEMRRAFLSSLAKARFLENLVASQKEKISAISRGRAEVLGEAVSSTEQASPGRWSEGQDGNTKWKEPSSEPGLDHEAGRESASSKDASPSHPFNTSCVVGPDPECAPCGISGALESRKLMLDMLFTNKSPPGLERTLLFARDQGTEEKGKIPHQEEEGQERMGQQIDSQALPLQSQFSVEAETSLKSLDRTQVTGGPLGPRSQPLKIQDLDFSDLCEEEDFDVQEAKVAETALPHMALGAGEGLAPPLIPGCAPPPPAPPPPAGIPGPPPPPPFSSPFPGGKASSPAKKKKTVKLFWSELKDIDGPARESRFGQATLWASLEKVEVDSAKLEHLFESRAKEIPSSKKAVDGRKLVVVLDPKRSNAINIGLTVLPPIHVIKAAILSFDEFAINKEGIEKILTMVPTEEEKQKIQEAQLANPNLPLGSAEQFLLTLSSIAELPARLQLWAFKLDYEALEKEIVEPLFDLKLGMEQLTKNQTFRRILATLLAMGNLLNGSQSRGFELSYLAKVSEVKDTVHRQSLLHHLCHFVVVEFPTTTDLYSEIAALTRCAKVDFEELAESVLQLERRCKASWEHLKAIAKHDCKPALKNKLLDFLQASTEKIGLLKIIHRRVLNRFHSFLLFLGYDAHSAQNMRVTSFCRLLREFALEYHTCRERVLQQQKKRAACRERNKTRGRMITEMEKFAVASKTEDGSAPPAVLSASPEQKEEASHKDLTSLLVSPAESPGHRSRASRGAGKQNPAGGSTPQEEAAGSPEDASEEIMNRLVKSVTQRSPARSGLAKERRRSRGNRKSLRRTLKSGLNEELVQALGLAPSASVSV
ncbi:FH1/FH2 domain-containing protein 1 [Crotalus adamanteus]|uniref:FH1/FH2 domain-containing protein 1 n=1 Tax=Crotalus adamanteus TaxID=8729 RepID=A0AAW1AUI0_CROAD